MKTRKTFFNFVLVLIHVAFKYEQQIRNKSFPFFCKWRNNVIIIALSKEEYKKGNYVAVSILRKQIIIDHYYSDNGKIYHLEKQSPLKQPNMLGGYDSKKRNMLDGNVLQDLKSGQAERDTLLHQIFCYLNRLGDFSKKHSAFSAAA